MALVFKGIVFTDTWLKMHLLLALLAKERREDWRAGSCLGCPVPQGTWVVNDWYGKQLGKEWCSEQSGNCSKGLWDSWAEPDGVRASVLHRFQDSILLAIKPTRSLISLKAKHVCCGKLESLALNSFFPMETVIFIMEFLLLLSQGFLRMQPIHSDCKVLFFNSFK